VSGFSTMAACPYPGCVSGKVSGHACDICGGSGELDRVVVALAQAKIALASWYIRGEFTVDRSNPAIKVTWSSDLFRRSDENEAHRTAASALEYLGLAASFLPGTGAVYITGILAAVREADGLPVDSDRRGYELSGYLDPVSEAA
jgi:hypothetical protein